MKKLIVLITCLFLVGSFDANAQFGYIKKKAKKAASYTVKKAKKVGSKTKKLGKKVVKKTKKAGSVTKKYGKKAAGKAQKYGIKGANGVRKYGGKGVRKVGKGFKKAGNVGVKGAKKVGRGVKRTGKYAAQGATNMVNSRVGKAIVKTASAPAKSVYNATKVVRGKAGVGSIYTPYVDAIGATGKAVPAVIKGITAPQRVLYQKAQNFAHKYGGRSGGFVFDISTFVLEYSPQLATALAENVSAVANGKNPIQVIGAPLAAALRAANTSHYNNSKPIPEDVKNALRGFFPESTLESARYTIGSVEITLPNAINKVAKYGEAHAVTVGNIIVFSKDPGSFSDTPLWWAHEMAHVDQYSKLGMEKFAYKYMKDLGKSIERQAERTAEDIVEGQ
ncbi:MAG: DUF4157 domain-containing protein [Saprospiraceae bacterium]|nr:DUF4157 domain-containing protein [Saprospiraceae bacterium]